jgi:hypothetical protein
LGFQELNHSFCWFLVFLFTGILRVFIIFLSIFDFQKLISAPQFVTDKLGIYSVIHQSMMINSISVINSELGGTFLPRPSAP